MLGINICPMPLFNQANLIPIKKRPGGRFDLESSKTTAHLLVQNIYMSSAAERPVLMLRRLPGLKPNTLDDNIGLPCALRHIHITSTSKKNNGPIISASNATHLVP